MQAGLCQGLFVDHFDSGRCARDWSQLGVLAYLYEPRGFARRITGELRRRLAAARDGRARRS